MISPSPDITPDVLTSGGDLADSDWLSVSDLARLRNVTRQSIHERVRKLVASNQLSVMGTGRGLRVHVPTFERITASRHDPAQDLRLRHVREPKKAPLAFASSDEAESPGADAPSAMPTYDEAQTRLKIASAQKAELDLQRLRGEVVPLAQFEIRAAAVGQRIAQAIAPLRTQSTALYAAGQQGGEDAVHILVNTLIDTALAQIVNAMLTIVSDENARDD